nr:NAD(P)H-binding protein [uncultured Mucilaginibacter sp.]
MQISTEKGPYKILVIGANGGIGKHCVTQALQMGHNVTALVRDPANLTFAHPKLSVVKGDIMMPGSYEKYFNEQDLVISALGVKGGLLGDKPTTLYSQGAANILQAMQKYNVKRAFFISASAVEISPVLPFYVRFAAKYIIQKLLKHMYADLLLMEQAVKASAANYTIIRPPQLTDKPVAGNYRIAINHFLKNGLKISRADVAHFMLNHIADTATYKATVEVAY